MDQKSTLQISVHLALRFNMLRTNCTIVLRYFINELHDFCAAHALPVCLLETCSLLKVKEG